MSWQEADRQRFEKVEARALALETKVGSTKTLRGSKTWDPPSVANAGNTTTTVTVTGAAVGDIARAAFTIVLVAGVTLTAQVTATDTVTVTLSNTSGGAVDLASGTLKAIVEQ